MKEKKGGAGVLLPYSQFQEAVAIQLTDYESQKAFWSGYFFQQNILRKQNRNKNPSKV